MLQPKTPVVRNKAKKEMHTKGCTPKNKAPPTVGSEFARRPSDKKNNNNKPNHHKATLIFLNFATGSICFKNMCEKRKDDREGVIHYSSHIII